MGQENEKTKKRWASMLAVIRAQSLRLGVHETEISREFFEFVLERFDRRCYNCGSEKKLTFDHNLPRSSGHCYTVDNTVVLCRCCNSEKNNHMPTDYYGVGMAAELRKKLRENAKGWIKMCPNAKIIGTTADLKNAEKKVVCDSEFFGYSRKALSNCFYIVFGDENINRKKYFLFRSAMEKLEKNEKEIISMYLDGKTQSEIAKKLNITQGCVCKMLGGNYYLKKKSGGIMQKIKKIINKMENV